MSAIAAAVSPESMTRADLDVAIADRNTKNRNIIIEELKRLLADRDGVRSMRDMEGLGLVCQAFDEAIAIDRALARLFERGALDLRSDLFVRMLKAQQRRALRLVALNGILERYREIPALLAARRRLVRVLAGPRYSCAPSPQNGG